MRDLLNLCRGHIPTYVNEYIYIGLYIYNTYTDTSALNKFSVFRRARCVNLQHTPNEHQQKEARRVSGRMRGVGDRQLDDSDHIDTLDEAPNLQDRRLSMVVSQHRALRPSTTQGLLGLRAPLGKPRGVLQVRGLSEGIAQRKCQELTP